MVRTGHLGTGAREDAVARASTRRTGPGRFDRLDHRARAPARRDPEARHRGARSNYKKFGAEPPDHAIGRSRGGLTTKNHLVCDGRARALAFVLTPGQAADTSMLIDTLSEIRVPGRTGRPRSRPERVPADKGYPSKANRTWLRERGTATTIPERDDQIAHRRKHPGRPIDFGREQKERYKRRNVAERCFNKLKQWRGIAMRSDKTARNYHSAICLAATLQWV